MVKIICNDEQDSKWTISTHITAQFILKPLNERPRHTPEGVKLQTGILNNACASRQLRALYSFILCNGFRVYFLSVPCYDDSHAVNNENFNCYPFIRENDKSAHTLDFRKV